MEDNNKKPNDHTGCSDTVDKDLSYDSESEANHDENLAASAQPDLVVANDENRLVWRLRLLVAFVLMTAMIAVCVGVYLNGRNDQQDSFEKEFAGLADKLVISFESVVKQRFGAIDMFFSGLTAYSNQTAWPLVTPPDYTRRASELHAMAGLSLSLLLPRIEANRRTEWEAYSNANQGHLREGLAYMQGVDAAEIDVTPIFPVIMDLESNPGSYVPESGPGPYYPIWMMHPPSNPSGINVNIHRNSENTEIMDFAVANKRPAFGLSEDYLDPTRPRDDRYNSFSNTPNWNYQDDAFAIAQFPVFDKLAGDRSVVAIFYTIIYWRTYFDGLLPKGSNGIHVILENTCGQQYTYIVDGLEAQFEGHGDLHSPEYDYLRRETKIDLILDRDQTFVDEDPTCHYSIRVYPSDTFRDSYETNEPALFAIVLAVVFVFTAAVFLLYDYMVERRQKVVMKSAMQSGKLVHSLFPEAVRDRLYEDQDQEAANKAATWKTGANGGVVERKQAIASEYPETTIFFADLVGFTKWSATRTPVEVFELLEALYGAFDTIANKRGVFKVETIGDCYVAVTGLPNPQEKHAEIMVRFSVDCLAKMRNVVLSLVDSLGDDTANLAMRVGLHSGPVTGGVLRGQKSRYQLFGDTVNTASRMESNGTTGMIHVSQSTADELVKLGRSSWLVACDEKLPIKGKGDMQTYFVRPTSLTTSVSRQSTN
ncbi:unnamed protein product [Cylindrotheca closterium]|uniref:Guanylate cyclase domain-containing protein n=1 Tax=Cylindrotheca closterium TaxID=2856 RepID=A0AAD2FSA0_9STRA|nr:unnamed protein product [Cylindrotheca closterium]